MRKNPYQVLGTEIATLRGRRNDWSNLLYHLQKPTPDHVSVVGPRYIGKTVLLNAVASYFVNSQNFFDACIFWDMRHRALDDDKSFYSEFARLATEPVKKIDREIGSALSETDGGTFETLRAVFETLAEEHKKVLFILDGLDRVLLAGALTKNLWDNLRALAKLSSLRFVTGSRRRLRELCASPESQTSDFWNIFAPTPLSLVALKDDDWDELLTPFEERKVTFLPGIRTELANWSGGVPVLISLLCRYLWDEVKEEESVTNEKVNTVAKSLHGNITDYLHELWNDCTEEERGDLAELAQGRELRANDFPQQRLRTLTQRGFVKEKGGALVCSCRFMEHYAKEHGARSTELRRLFGDPKNFDSNIKGFLELHFGQLDNIDEMMRDYVYLAIRSLDKPHLVVGQMRGLANRALDIIWEKELSSGVIPEEWTRQWQHDGERNPPSGKVPSGRGQQCKLLQLMVDPRKGGMTRVSRSTYLLVDHLQSVGDFGQHQDGESVPSGFCVAICLAAIELCEQLAKALKD